MNKIVLQSGFLVFFLSVIFFSRIGLPPIEVVFRSFIFFVAATVMLGIIVIVFIKSINRSSIRKKEILENNNRK